MTCYSPYALGDYSLMDIVSAKKYKHLLKENGGHYNNLTTVALDPCIKEEIIFLWENQVVTMGSCCGHQTTTSMVNVSQSSVSIMEKLGYIKQLSVHENHWEHTYYLKTGCGIENVYK